MRSFFRPAERAALIALTLVIAPLSNRLAAQDSQLANAEPVVVTRDSVVRDSAVPEAVAAPFDLRAVHIEASPVASAAVQSRTSLAVSMTGLRSGVHVRENVGPLVVNAAAKNANLGQSQALMIVGAAALITGAIIGDDPGTIIMVGGAVIGLYGLYQYLQ